MASHCAGAGWVLQELPSLEEWHWDRLPGGGGGVTVLGGAQGLRDEHEMGQGAGLGQLRGLFQPQ